MITLTFVYAVVGAMFAGFAIMTLLDRTHPKRLGSAAFWALLAASFLGGNHFGNLGNGILVILLVALGGTGQVALGTSTTTTPAERQQSAKLLGNRLFLCALIIPAIAVLGTIGFKHWPAIADAKQATLIALTFGALIAVAIVLAWLKPPVATPLQEGRRLIEAVGWAVVLPQMLASLGAVFALAGVGDVVGTLMGHAIPEGSRLGAVIAYGAGMALFTMIMGNAFAAFPVMTAAIGLPLLITAYHGNPAVVGALGMLCGFCGTLMTPMAANFNIVPAVLLDLKDRNGVIKAQVPTAVPMLVVNIALLYFLAWR